MSAIHHPTQIPGYTINKLASLQEEDDYDKYSIVCDSCEKEYRIDTMNYTHNHRIDYQIRNVVLEHRISCSKRFISKALILDTNEGLDHNFSILLAHHFCLKTEVVERIQTITRSWDITKVVIEEVLKSTPHPSMQRFMEVLQKIAKTYQSLATIEKVAFAATKKQTPITSSEIFDMFHGWDKPQNEKIKAELSNVFVKKRWNEKY